MSVVYHCRSRVFYGTMSSHGFQRVRNKDKSQCWLRRKSSPNPEYSCRCQNKNSRTKVSPRMKAPAIKRHQREEVVNSSLVQRWFTEWNRSINVRLILHFYWMGLFRHANLLRLIKIEKITQAVIQPTINLTFWQWKILSFLSPSSVFACQFPQKVYRSCQSLQVKDRLNNVSIAFPSPVKEKTWSK